MTLCELSLALFANAFEQLDKAHPLTNDKIPLDTLFKYQKLSAYLSCVSSFLLDAQKNNVIQLTEEEQTKLRDLLAKGTDGYVKVTDLAVQHIMDLALNQLSGSPPESTNQGADELSA